VTDPLHADALALLRGWAAPDAWQEQVRRDYVQHLELHPDGLRRDCLPDHVTASTLVVSADRTQVLLTLHAKANAWFQMGGHCEPADRTLAGAAQREADEESGVAGLALDPQPVQLNTHDVGFCDPRATVRHLDVRFVAVAPDEAAHTASVESLDVGWWPVDALPTSAPDIRELVRLSRARLAQSTGSSPAS
jgi:8-oxo-dGTP pyrophosphatase MutT (NUDIX family)